MDKQVMRLLLYSRFAEDEILPALAQITADWKEKKQSKDQLVHRIYQEIKKLLDLGTTFGFDGNLWQNYLTFLLMNNENSFTLTCERVGAGDGTVNQLAKQDLQVFRNLFFYDFAPMEQDLEINCFTAITHYQAISKREQIYDREAGEMIRSLSQELAASADVEAMFAILTDYYRLHGVGMFAMHRAFRIKHEEGKDLEFCPVSNAERIRLSDLIGYELQKKQLRDNTEAFVAGRTANNVLLYGDAGTGKSSSVKAILNEYADQGLRMIEIYKYQFRDLSAVIAQIKKRNYRFIIYIDDLSFEAEEVEYKFLKAVIEGGVETRPDNILIYATSNRRHLIKETWNDKNDMEFQGDIHRSDTVQEKLSLASRFGVLIDYSAPNRKAFHDIVEGLAAKHPQIKISKEELLAKANQWELRHGGISGRTAQQFIDDLAGKQSDPSL